MNIIDREMYLLYAETDEYQESIRQLKENISKALSEYSNPYVAYSGGKDSLVMSHAVLQENPDTLIYHWDYGPYYMPRKIEQEVRDIALSIGAENFQVDSTPLYKLKKREAQGILGRILYGRVMKEMKNLGYDLCFVGLRAQEGCKRRKRVSSLFEKELLTNCFPVRHLKTRDIWCLPYETKLMTTAGEMYIGDIITDEWKNIKVLGSSGFVKILNVFSGSAKQFIIISSNNGEILKCTENHRIFTKNKGWVPANKINIGDVLISYNKKGDIYKESKMDSRRGLENEGGVGTSARSGFENNFSQADHGKFIPTRIYTGIKNKPDVYLQTLLSKSNKIYTRRSCIYGRDIGRGRMDRHRETKTIFWKLYLQPSYRRNKHLYSTIGIPCRKITDIYKTSKFEREIWYKSSVSSADKKLTKGNRCIGANTSVHDSEEKTSRINTSVLLYKKRRGLSCKCHGRGNCNLRAAEEFKFIYTKVIKIDREQQHIKIYDIMTESENFFANGLLVHNSYIVSNNLPYCSHYDIYGSLEEWENVRFCTYFDPEFAKFGCSNLDGVLMTDFKNR